MLYVVVLAAIFSSSCFAASNDFHRQAQAHQKAFEEWQNQPSDDQWWQQAKILHDTFEEFSKKHGHENTPWLSQLHADTEKVDPQKALDLCLSPKTS